MTEDRFGDLGDGEGRGDAESRGSSRDQVAPERARADGRTGAEHDPPGGPQAGPGGLEHPGARRRSHAVLIGIALLVGLGLLGVVLVPQARDGGGLRGPAPGSALPVFAAPLATGGVRGDANVSQTSGDSQAAGPRPACEVRGPGILNLCELRRRPLVLAFIVTQGAECASQLDVIERVRRDFPEVAFAAVVSGDSHEEVEAIVRRRMIGFPVAVDPDGALVNLYGIAACPTTTVARRGGRVVGTEVGRLSEDELRLLVERLPEARGGDRADGAGRRGSAPPGDRSSGG